MGFFTGLSLLSTYQIQFLGEVWRSSIGSEEPQKHSPIVARVSTSLPSPLSPLPPPRVVRCFVFYCSPKRRPRKYCLQQGKVLNLYTEKLNNAYGALLPRYVRHVRP